MNVKKDALRERSTLELSHLQTGIFKNRSIQSTKHLNLAHVVRSEKLTRLFFLTLALSEFQNFHSFAKILKYDFGFQFGQAGRIGSSLAVLHIDVRLVIGREKENVKISVETL